MKHYSISISIPEIADRVAFMAEYKAAKSLPADAELDKHFYRRLAMIQEDDRWVQQASRMLMPMLLVNLAPYVDDFNASPDTAQIKILLLVPQEVSESALRTVQYLCFMWLAEACLIRWIIQAGIPASFDLLDDYASRIRQTLRAIPSNPLIRPSSPF